MSETVDRALYLNLDCSNQSNAAHGEHGKKQTHQFIQRLMAREDKSLNGIRSEMQKWVTGYSFFSLPSNTNDQSRKRRYLGRYFAHPMMQNRRAKRDDYKSSAVRVTQRYVP
ncbi:hypothetical protein PsalMR5_00903 [Piscirickettsia salmonis]|uniref:hypothetical protein n=1 Tax=Piscirickettsia salmonis TaxID=1238 RepID=UPI0012BAC3DB|nr:hypothetical protein [Piscirickettsia salmonis]QGP53489.1 hypothetical protein PsalSR1_00902 [Piscirickettsia salmonis]QGP63057.1 hypothetical protein PsalMR5_00903 [Piscirickettsia salmonis]